VTITSDWHIHSRNSCDEASLAIANLISGAGRAGIVDYGVTDHIHTPCNLPDLDASRAEYMACGPSEHFHFGVEVSCVSRWELDRLATQPHDSPTYGIRTGGPCGAEPALALTEADIARLGIEYVIGGTHWPLYVPFERDAIIADYHRQNMFLATHPLVDIVAHPWWWMGHWRDPDGRYTTDPWLDDFTKIPRAMHDEFAAAAVQHAKVVEINLGATLLNRSYPQSFAAQYVEYLAGLKARGVRFSIGSDCHAGSYAPDFERAAQILAPLGLRDDDLWRLSPRG
jgi:histidinol phosphatase-like PHP family hydrolase